MNTDLNGVPLREAADHLQTTVEAVRMRIRRKSLHAYKVDGRWYVVLPERDQDATEHATSEQTTIRDHEQQTGLDQDAVHLQSIIDRQDEEIAFLRRQVDAERQAHRETRATLMQLTQRVPELAASNQPREERSQDVQHPDATIDAPVPKNGRLARLFERWR